jgi:hypothetical protein
MDSKFKDPVTQKIADFISNIGLDLVRGSIGDNTFLPGILVRNGSIIVDEEKLRYPGDLLHEAGHLALAPAEIRPSLSGEVALPGTAMEPIEAQAMAWSYAAALSIGIDPKVVFHEGGYFGASESLLLNFSIGVYLGVNGLQEAGLTTFGESIREETIPSYPHMIKWLRD